MVSYIVTWLHSYKGEEWVGMEMLDASKRRENPKSVEYAVAGFRFAAQELLPPRNPETALGGAERETDGGSSALRRFQRPASTFSAFAR